MPLPSWRRIFCHPSSPVSPYHCIPPPPPYSASSRPFPLAQLQKTMRGRCNVTVSWLLLNLENIQIFNSRKSFGIPWILKSLLVFPECSFDDRKLHKNNMLPALLFQNYLYANLQNSSFLCCVVFLYSKHKHKLKGLNVICSSNLITQRCSIPSPESWNELKELFLIAMVIVLPPHIYIYIYDAFTLVP